MSFTLFEQKFSFHSVSVSREEGGGRQPENIQHRGQFGLDYILFKHINDKLFQQKPVQQQAAVVNIYQTVSQQAAPPGRHTVVHPPAPNRETERQREMEIVSAIQNDRLKKCHDMAQKKSAIKNFKLY